MGSRERIELIKFSPFRIMWKKQLMAIFLASLLTKVVLQSKVFFYILTSSEGCYFTKRASLLVSPNYFVPKLFVVKECL